MIMVKMFQRTPHAKKKIPSNGATVHQKDLKSHEQFAITKSWIKLNSILYIIHIRF